MQRTAQDLGGHDWEPGPGHLGLIARARRHRVDRTSEPGGSQLAGADFCPTPLRGNRLLFVSSRANHCGGSSNNPDIYLTRLHPVKGWLTPQPLPCGINSGFEEFSPSLVESDGLTMLFFPSSRDDAPRHRIHMAVLQPNGSWATAAVHELNFAGASDAGPSVMKDGLESPDRRRRRGAVILGG